MKNGRIQNFIELIIILISLLFMLFGPSAIGQTTFDYETTISRLIDIANFSNDKRQKLEALDSIAFLHENVDTTQKYAKLECDLARELHDPIKLARGLRFRGWAFYNKNDYEKAKSHFFDACALMDSIKYFPELACCYHQLGICLAMQNDYISSDNYFQKALKLYNELGDSIHTSDLYTNMGQAALEYKLFDIANDYFQKAQIISQQINDTTLICEGYYYLAYSPFCQYKMTQADSLLNKAYYHTKISLELAKQTSSEYYKIRTYEIASLTFLELAQKAKEPRLTEILDSVKTFINEGIQISLSIGYESEKNTFEIYKAKYNIVRGKYALGKKQLDDISLILSNDTINADEYLIELYDCYILYYEAVGNLAEIIKYQKKRNIAERSQLKYEYLITSTQSRSQAEFDKKMHEREIAELKKEAIYREREAAQRFITFLIGLFILGMIIFIIILFKDAKRQKLLNKTIESKNSILEQQQEEMRIQNIHLSEQKDIIESANQQIRASIEYAQRIQSAAMPSQEIMKSMFGENLVIFKPLDIVSGDFFWTAYIGHYKAIAVADCTGHGVPGAFMSMLGLSLLNDLTAAFNHLDGNNDISASDILNLMRENIKYALHQTNNDNDTRDGMDVALCLIDTQKSQIQFAGAFRPLFIIRNGELIEYAGDRMPVGVHMRENDSFTNHVIDVFKDDLIYLFSDGITDQFGYADKCCKFTAKRLRNMLLQCSAKSFAEQKEFIEHSLLAWRQPHVVSEAPPCEQTDDILLIGLKI